MTATFYVGDAIEVMSKLPEKSVDLVLTSPPFLALRSYLPADHPDKALEGGSQATPGAFIDWLIDVVEACDRVLAPHGSLCIELGDTYAGSGGAGGDYNEEGLREGQPIYKGSNARKEHRIEMPDGRTIQSAGISNGLPRKGTGWPLAKSLSLIPELFRFTLVYGFNPLTGRQTERWRLRNVVRWVRPNPPVGALGDKFRPATSELMVFCKSAKRYFDLDAVRTEHASEKDAARTYTKKLTGHLDKRETITLLGGNPAGAPPLDWWNIPLLEGEEPTKGGPKEKPTNRPAQGERKQQQMLAEGVVTHGVSVSMANRTYHKDGGAPPLDWWNIPPGGYEGAHYAVFPPELCIKPIKAMCPEKVCRVCGEPSRRIVGEADYLTPDGSQAKTLDMRVGTRADPGVRVGTRSDSGVNQWSVPGSRTGGFSRVTPTLGWTDCSHDDWRPGLVLDPFGGSGTTALVATGHGRDCILIDLDERNYDLALERVGPFILSRAESV